MTEVVLVGLAVAAGAPLRRVGVVAAALVLPWGVVGALAVAILVARATRPPRTDGRVAVLTAITAELRAGRSLRSALHAGCDGGDHARVGRRARLGVPIGEVVADLAAGLGRHGPLVAASLGLAERGGGSALSALETVIGLLRDDLALEAEVRSAAAPARASVLAVVAAPLLFLGLQSLDGSFPALLDSPGGVVMAVGGSTLIALGVVASLLLARRVR